MMIRVGWWEMWRVAPLGFAQQALLFRIWDCSKTVQRCVALPRVLRVFGVGLSVDSCPALSPAVWKCPQCVPFPCRWQPCPGTPGGAWISAEGPRRSASLPGRREAPRLSGWPTWLKPLMRCSPHHMSMQSGKNIPLAFVVSFTALVFQKQKLWCQLQAVIQWLFVT